MGDPPRFQLGGMIQQPPEQIYAISASPTATRVQFGLGAVLHHSRPQRFA